MAAPAQCVRLPAGPAPGSLVRVLVGGRRVCVANVAGTLFAFDDACPHRSGSLAAGRLEGGALTCLQHGWRFDVGTGGCVAGGRGHLARHDVTVQDGAVVVTLRRRSWPERLREAVARTGRSTRIGRSARSGRQRSRT